MQILDDQGQPLAVFGHRDGGGVLDLYGKGGFLGVEAATEEKGGFVKTLNSLGKVMTLMERARTGDGVIAVVNRNGNRMVVMDSDDTGKTGRVAVQREGGIPLIKLDADDKGGYVQTMDGKAETSRTPAK